MVKYTCEKCESEFDNATSYNRHLQRTTDCSKDPDRKKVDKYKCEHCKKILSRKDKLVYHIKICPKNPRVIAAKAEEAKANKAKADKQKLSANKPPKRTVTESVRKAIAGRQDFKCANEPDSNILGLEDFQCPLWQKTDPRKRGTFDEAFCQIDHKVEFCLTHDDSEENLQALCRHCHDVKTKRFNRGRNKIIDDDNKQKKFIVKGKKLLEKEKELIVKEKELIKHEKKLLEKEKQLIAKEKELLLKPKTKRPPN